MNHSLNLNMFHRLYFAFMAVLTLMCSCSSDRPDSLSRICRRCKPPT